MTTRKGLCCRAFPLPYGPEDLDKSYNNVLRTMGLSDMFGWVPTRQYDDGTMTGWTFSRMPEGIEDWWPWLRFVGMLKDNPLDGREYRKPLPSYTCIKHDPETGSCTAYDQRPHFCRSYGTLEVPCEYSSETCECGVIHAGEESERKAEADAAAQLKSELSCMKADVPIALVQR